jgi:hypothetical protein
MLHFVWTPLVLVDTTVAELKWWSPYIEFRLLNMSSTLTKQAVSVYLKHMQIEGEFRDMKRRLNGLGFEHNKSKLLRRLAVLILMTTLAWLVAMLIGLTVISAVLYRHYQAKTVKQKRLRKNMYCPFNR